MNAIVSLPLIKHTQLEPNNYGLKADCCSHWHRVSPLEALGIYNFCFLIVVSELCGCQQQELLCVLVIAAFCFLVLAAQRTHTSRIGLPHQSDHLWGIP